MLITFCLKLIFCTYICKNNRSNKMNTFTEISYETQLHVLLTCTVVLLIIWIAIIYKSFKIKLPK